MAEDDDKFARSATLDDEQAVRAVRRQFEGELSQYKEALRASEARFRSVVEGSRQGIIIQQDERIVYANPAMADLFGYASPDQLIGLNPFDDLINDSLQLFRTRTAAAYRGERLKPTDAWRARHRLGKVLWICSTAHPSEWNGRPAVTSFYTDVTERQLAEIGLRDREARYRSALQAGRMGAWETDLIGRTRTWTEEGLALFGLALPDGQGQVGGPGDELAANMHPDDRHLLASYHAQAEVTDSFPAEYRILRADGTVVWLSGRSQVIDRTPEGRAHHLVSIMVDITERKRAEAALRESERRFRATFDNAAVGIAHVAPDGSWLRVNDRLCRIVGYSAEELTIKTFQDITHPDDLGADLALVARVLSGAIDDYDLEKRYLRKDGSTVWINLTVSCVRKEDGAVDYFISVIEDISGRKRAEAALRESEERMRVAAHAGNIGLCVLDLATQKVRGTSEYFGLFGLPPSDEPVPVEFIRARYLPEDRAQISPAMEDSIRTGTPLSQDRRILMPDGGLRWLHCVSDTGQDAAGRPVARYGAVVDITERKGAEEALREREARLRAIVETAADAIIVIDEAGLVQSVNRAAERIFGYAPDEIIGRNVDVLMPEGHARAHDSYLEAYRRTGERKIIGIGREVEGRRKDGVLFPLDLAMAEWRDARGRRFFTGIMRDISERKRREEQVQVLMREVNHRAKNLLTVVQVIARHTAKSSRPEDFAERLIDRLQGLSQSQDLIVGGDWQQVALVDLVRAQLRHLGATLDRRVHITGEPLTVTPAAAQSIGMALHELATNAMKYGALSGDNGRVSIAWLRSAQAPGRRFIMTWSEHGGPPILTPKRRGFGRTLIEEMTASAVGGEVECRYDQRGLYWRLDAPEAEVIRLPDHETHRE
jgi:PAS domain S-box-containing protein